MYVSTIKSCMYPIVDKYVNIRYVCINNKDVDVSKKWDIYVSNSKNIRYVCTANCR